MAPVRRSSVHRATGRKPALLKSSRPEHGRSEALMWAGYQQQIVELEGTITHLRRRLMEANAALADTLKDNAQLSDLFQNAPVGYIIHDDAGDISGFNGTARKMLGLERSPGTVSLTQFMPNAQIYLWLDHLRRANASLRATTDLLLLGRGGKLIPVQLITITFPIPHSPKVFRTILSDISQRRAAELALAATQRDYHHLIDTIEGIVWEADAQTMQVTFVSGYAKRLLGYPMADWKRPGFWQNRIYVEDRERVANAIALAAANRQTLRIDYRVVTIDRRILWLHDNITTLQRERSLYLLGVAVDVTEQHQAAESLNRNKELLAQGVAERTAELRLTVQELESFSYSISHDLRAPLRAMIGFAEIAQRQDGAQLPPEAKDCLQRIVEAGLLADRLVQDVLAYSRVSRANFKLVRIELNEFVPSLITQYPDFQPPKASIQVRQPLKPVAAHEALLAQCLTNLLSNAVKFVSPGAVAQIKIWTEPTPDEQSVRLWIEDKGIGIEPQNLGRIFNIFERVHSSPQFQGTGIGLAIVRKAVERMGGTVGVESEPGKGSKFWIQLRAA